MYVFVRVEKKKRKEKEKSKKEETRKRRYFSRKGEGGGGGRNMERPSCVCLCLLDLAENPLSLWANIGCVHPIVAGHGGCHGCPRTILAPLFDLALGGVNGARG